MFYFATSASASRAGDGLFAGITSSSPHSIVRPGPNAMAVIVFCVILNRRAATQIEAMAAQLV